MCMVVYVASEVPLATSEWSAQAPGFHVTPVGDADAVLARFSKPFVYYTGSHQGCGCGFQLNEYFTSDADRAEQDAVRESRRRLADFLADALTRQPEVELFACWDGSESQEPVIRERIRPQDLLGARTRFEEGEFLVVSNRS
jgi:hypothetical protein